MKAGLKLWQPFLLIALLFSPFLIWGQSLPVAASEPVLQWQQLNTPQNGAAGNFILNYNSEVNRIAIGSDNSTIYALDSHNTRLYKSSDAGYTWVDLSGNVASDASWNEIAIAPDNANIIAIVTNNRRQVYFSVDGGTNFRNTALAGLDTTEIIRAIAVSPAYFSHGNKVWDIAIGTMIPGAAGGRFFLLSLGIPSTWKDMSTGVAGWVTSAGVFAITFSPKYASDRTILALVADNADTYLYTGQKRDQYSVTWNHWAGYPVKIVKPGEDSPHSPLTYASLALPSDYNGIEPSLRRVYALWSDGVGGNVNDDVYRIDDTRVVRLYAGNGVEFVASSLAYYGTHDAGKLLVGMHATPWLLPNPPHVQIKRTLNPQDRFPTWQESRKPPTGPGEAQVAWSPDGKIAYCGTTTISGAANDESAFSRSNDDGLSWNQTGLIDTVISRVNDLEPSPKGGTLFVTTINTGAANADSLWKITSPPQGKWERILSRSSTGTGDKPQVKVAPDYAETGVVWYIGIDTSLITQQLLVSYDRGNVFEARGSNLVLIDLAIEDKNTLYGLSAAGLVSKSIDGGWSWGTPVITGLGSGYSIATAHTGSTPDNLKGHVIVGGTGIGSYDVAYSTNGGATFIPIPAALPTPRGNTLVLASSGYKTDGTILAKTADGIFAWGIYSGKNVWERRGWSFGFKFTGMAISRDGIAYASTLRTTGGKSGVSRGLGSPNFLANLDPAVTFNATPRGLKLSGGLEVNEPVTLWAVDTRPYSPPVGGVWYYTDTLVWLGPPPTQPVSEAVITDYDLATGRAGSIVLKWQPRSLSDSYQIQIALDEDFATIIVNIGAIAPFYYPHDSLNPALVLPVGGGTITDRKGNTWTVPALVTGKTYYWRVRGRSVIGGDIFATRWSWRESFVITMGLPVKASSSILILSPKIGAMDISLTPVFSWTPVPKTNVYEFILSRDAALTDIVTKATVSTPAYLYHGKLEPGKTYFWRVRAIEPFLSDWSAIGIFTTERSIPTELPQKVPSPILILSPKIGAMGISLTPVFSWTHIPGTTKYEFILSRDAALTDIITKATVSTPAYLHQEKLKPGKTYFWQVRAIEPVPSDWSDIGIFTTERSSPEIVQSLPSFPSPPVPFWIYLTIIIIGLTWWLLLAFLVRIRYRS